jgi:NADH-quinone oxidoreductase subunit A
MDTSQTLPAYVPLLILVSAALGFALFTVVVSWILGRPRPNPVKSSLYECGIPPQGTARQRFPVKFYLICMIFILFDVDAAFLYPWALVFRELGGYGLAVMGAFLAILAVGDVYAWKIGAFEW